MQPSKGLLGIVTSPRVWLFGAYLAGKLHLDIDLGELDSRKCVQCVYVHIDRFIHTHSYKCIHISA